MAEPDFWVKAGWAGISESWIAWLDCEIAYDGAALGFLQKGSRIVSRKKDGSVGVMGGDLNKLKNYIRATKCVVENDIITFSNKKEKLTVKVYNCFWVQHLTHWSTDKVQLYRTEDQLVEKFCKNVHILIPEAAGGTMIREYQLQNSGKVDVAIFKNNKTWLVELKRKKVTQNVIGQVMKYRDHAKESDLHLYIVAPEISDNALKYATENNIKFIELDWDPVPIAFAKLLEG